MVPVTHLTTSMQGGGSILERQVSPLCCKRQRTSRGDVTWLRYIKRGCDLPEVRANVYHVPAAARDPRSYFCALTVQQTLCSSIWLWCQLGDMVFLVCASESELCSLLVSALH